MSIWDVIWQIFSNEIAIFIYGCSAGVTLGYFASPARFAYTNRLLSAKLAADAAKREDEERDYQREQAKIERAENQNRQIAAAREAQRLEMAHRALECTQNRSRLAALRRDVRLQKAADISHREFIAEKIRLELDFVRVKGESCLLDKDLFVYCDECFRREIITPACCSRGKVKYFDDPFHRAPPYVKAFCSVCGKSFSAFDM